MQTGKCLTSQVLHRDLPQSEDKALAAHAKGAEF